MTQLRPHSAAGKNAGDPRAAAETKKMVVACATVIEEMLPLLPAHVGYRVLEFGLHVDAARLRQTLQTAIDEAGQNVDTIILGYGLCSQAVIGLRATCCTLVVPRVDDCIAIFLGSGAAYRAQFKSEPGTYYLTKGWIEVGDSPFAEYERLAERWGKDRADRVVRLMLKNYTRLALINTGQHDLERYRHYSRLTADRFGLRYEEIKGSTDLVKKMITGPWEEDFVIVRPGEVIELELFFGGNRGK